MFLYGMRPYVIVVGCVHVPGVPVVVKSGHRDSMTRFHQDRNSRHTHTHTTDNKTLWVKNPQHTFLRRGSKAVGTMLQICGM